VHYNRWVWDSGTSRHITPYCSSLSNVRKLEEPVLVETGGGEIHKGVAVGTLHLVISCDGTSRTITFNDVLHVPTFRHQLLSMRRMWRPKEGFTIEYSQGSNLSLVYKGQRIAQAVWDSGVPVMVGTPAPTKSTATVGSYGPTGAVGLGQGQGLSPEGPKGVQALVGMVPTAAQTLHESMGHPSHRVLAEAISQGLITGTDVKPKDVLNLPQCGPCIEGKQRRTAFPESSRKGTHKLGELIHFDYCGPLRTIAVGGYDGFILGTDDYSRIAVVVLMKGKGSEDCLKAVNSVVARVRRQGDLWTHPLTVRFDRGREMVNNRFKAECSANGVNLETSTAHTSQQNGVAERMNGVLMEKVRVQLRASGLPFNQWGDVLVAAAMQHNRLPCSANPGNMTPWERFTGKKPDVSYFHPIGQEGYVLKLPRNAPGGPGKLGPVSEKGVLVGYSLQSKAWRFKLGSGRIVESRDVKWLREPAAMATAAADMESVGAAEPPDLGGDADSSAGEEEKEEPPVDPHEEGGEQPHGDLPDSEDGELPDGGQQEQQEPAPPEPRRGARERRAPERLIASYSAQLAKDVFLPANNKQARASPQAALWKDAVADELQAMWDKGVMQPVGRAPPGVKPIPTRMVFTVKSDSAGLVVKLKARLVARGDYQQPGDHGDTYAPTGSMGTFRSVLAVTARRGDDLQQMDFASAFLQAGIKEEVYITLPHDVEGGEAGVVYKLNRAIYGLKQSPRAWYDKLAGVLEGIELFASDSDTALFVKRGKTEAEDVLLFCHVDDLLISGSTDAVKRVKQQIAEVLDVKDLGEPKVFLGMEIERDWKRGTITLSQRQYTAEVLDKYDMTVCKPLSAPADYKYALSKEGGELLGTAGVALYRELVGSVMYLASGTRPDIAQSVGVLGRFMQEPRKPHLVAAKHVLRYLAGTRSMGIRYGGGKPGVVIFSDSDYAGELERRRSTTGYVVIIDGAAVSWSSRIQHTVALSTQEAEYMALAAAIREALSMRKTFSDFHLSVPVMDIRSDNTAAISLAHNPMVQARSKHIDVHHHFARDRVMRGEVKLSYVPTQQMVADVLTKALEPARVKWCRDGMGLVELRN
jgi:Reverse transcriptase (RNA-dependent DNA polymerase)